MSQYSSAHKQLKTGVSKQVSGKIQGVIEKSKILKSKIQSTQKEIQNELSHHSASNDSIAFAQIPQNQSQQQNQQSLNSQNISHPLQEQGFVLQSAKLQLDQLEDDILNQKLNNKKQKLSRKQSDTESKQASTAIKEETKSNTSKAYKDVFSICPDTDSEPELYIPDSIIVFIKNINFIGFSEKLDFEVAIRFFVTVDGVPNQFKLFDLNSTKNLILVQSHPFVYQYRPDFPVILPYIENSSMQINFSGNINNFEVSGSQQFSQFMRGNFQQQFTNQRQLLLQNTELIYDNFLTQNLYEDNNFNVVLDKKRFGDSGMVQKQELQKYHLLPMRTQLYAFACQERNTSMEFQRSQLNFQQIKQKLLFNGNILLQGQIQASQSENKGVQYQLDELVEHKEQQQRLQQVDKGIFFDQVRQEYFIKQAPEVQQDTPLKELHIQDSDFISSLREPAASDAQLFIQRLEFDCLGEYSSSIIQVTVSHNETQKTVMQNQPIAAGHAIFNQSIPLFELKQRQVSPLIFHVLVGNFADTKQLTCMFTLEQLKYNAASEKWLDLQPYGRMKCKIASLPSLINRNFQFLDERYQLINVQQPTIYANGIPAPQRQDPKPRQPINFNMNANVEIGSFQNELSSILSQMGNSESFELESRQVENPKPKTPIISSNIQPQHDLALAQQLIQAMNQQHSSVQEEEISHHEPVKQASPKQDTSEIAEKVRQIAYQLSSESGSEEEEPAERGSSWARQQAKKIFGGQISSESSSD